MTSSAAADPSGSPATGASPFYPLDALYAREGLALPRIEVVDGALVPEPYRSLLVHECDMTPTLERFHRSGIHIEVWGRERAGDRYFRQVVLRLDRDQRAVEFGANKVNLALFEPAVQRLILDEYLPLGHILNQRGIPHHGRPQAYLRLESDALIGRAFRLRDRTVLWGRRNTIRDDTGRPLSEVVEILPPVPG